MPPIPPLAMTQVQITGPLWSAQVEVIQLADPRQNWAFRNLFVDTQAQAALSLNTIHLPGTMLLLAFVRQVEVKPNAQTTYRWQRGAGEKAPNPRGIAAIEAELASGQLSLLLVQGEPDAWPNTFPQTTNPPAATQPFFPPLTCLVGDISLDRLSPVNDARTALYRALRLGIATPASVRDEGEVLLGQMTVNGSGLSLYGAIDLPWESESIAAPFLLTRTFAPGVASGIRLNLESERFTFEEQENWSAAWNRFSRYINPRNPQNGTLTSPPPSPNWVTLEVTNPIAVPQLFWEIASWGDIPQLNFALDEVTVFLSDQSPYDQTRPPSSLARLIHERVQVRKQDEKLVVEVSAGLIDGAGATLSYSGQRNDPAWAESLRLKDVAIAFSPTETPSFLRQQQQLPTPQWSPPNPLEPEVLPIPLESEVLWGFMPLENGWAQLPIPNLTEQIYLDSGLSKREAQSRSATANLSRIQGAVSLGNDRRPLLSQSYPNEQPWNLVLANSRSFKGEWTLTPTTDQSRYELNHIRLILTEPDITLNGLFWLSTGLPTVADALPDLENWVSGLRSFSLRTVRPNADLFPPVVVLTLETLKLSARDVVATQPITAQLQVWALAYGINQLVFEQLEQANVLSPDALSRYLPWVWQHHPALPMIQALPLTQSQSPPNHPSASRQLIPFELDPAKLPKGWRFGVEGDNGASRWPVLLDAAAPAQDWRSNPDLPLVALSLPGLILEPSRVVNATPVEFTQLPLQYRFDLPYTDENNALAQLPSVIIDPEAVSPLPASEMPLPVEPLTRETFADHWQRLSEMASLASADAVVAFTIPSPNGQPTTVTLENLVEPLSWSLQASLNLEEYPGQLNLNNGGAIAPQALSGESALEGISGEFQSPEGTPFTLRAGSLEAHATNGGLCDQRGLRDQRGLVRFATRHIPESPDSKLLQTPVTLHRTPNDAPSYELTSTLTTIALKAGGTDWKLWFRDVPIREGRFERAKSFSNLVEDINDPEAISRLHNVLTGYEWRLAIATPPTPLPAYLPLFNLHFYPLTLETVTLASDEISSVEIIGRLQLPLAGGGEITDLNNAVRLTFTGSAQSELTLSAVALVASQGEWPLAMTANELSSGPHLTWSGISLAPNRSGLSLQGVRLNFFLFETGWSLPLPENLDILDSPPLEKPEPFTYKFPLNTQAPLTPTEAKVTLNLKAPNYAHTAELFLAIRLGNTQRAAFTANLEVSLLAANNLVWKEGTLFEDLTLFEDPTLPEDRTLSEDPSLSKITHTVLQTPLAFQFQWQQYEAGAAFQLLPGMLLSADRSAPGFAAVTFEAIPNGDFPTLRLRSAVVETLLLCQWGTGLTASASERSPQFASSSGDLAFGYTNQWQPESQTWAESMLLNGLLEVQNLISWPQGMQVDSEETETYLTLPKLPDGQTAKFEDVTGPFRPLAHWRHSLRILLNQHPIPPNLLVAGQNELLFQLGDRQSWQFLAVVEHQLVALGYDIQPSNGTAGHVVETRGQTHRWSVVQEVRLTSPAQFKQVLKRIDPGGAQNRVQTPDPVDGTGFLGDRHESYFSREVRSLLASDNGALDRLAAATLLVEASAPLWINQQPVAAATPTTLQFLPNGAQMAILSNPQDYRPSDPRSPQWLLLAMPFLGRLQHDATAIADSNNPLQADPIKLLATKTLTGAELTLALTLTSWGLRAVVTLRVSGFDSAAGRTWARLDPLALEESWFRLQNPPSEAIATGLQSSMAALPDTPARLSRAAALQSAVDPRRSAYPPRAAAGGTTLGDRANTDALVWQINSLLAPQAVSATSSSGLVALYTFRQDPTNRARVADVSGVGAALDLVIRDPNETTWLPGGGLSINRKTIITSIGAATKITNACRRSQQLTIEAWVKPANLTQSGPARIVTFSNSKNHRNFTLGQGFGEREPQRDPTRFVARVRTAANSPGSPNSSNGRPDLPTPLNIVTTTLTHLVFIRDLSGMIRLYVNGKEEASSNRGGDFNTWEQSFGLALGDEFDRDRPWLGEYHRVAIYDRALSRREVELAFANGPQHDSGEPSALAYSWHVTGLQLETSKLLNLDTNKLLKTNTGLLHHAAATVVPARLTVEKTANPFPLSLTVSPYLGLEFRPAPALNQTVQRLVLTELLCLDAVSSSLLPVASRLWDDLGELGDRRQRWAREIHLRQAPESTVAILRSREVNENTAPPSITTATLITTYSFQIVTTLELPQPLVSQVFRLRSTVPQLRFREGQFGGLQLSSNVKSFELAPPQVTGVQPIYLPNPPDVVAPDPAPQPWPWGVSALRYSVRYTTDEQAVIGAAKASDDAASLTLWWQAPHYQVQFRSALSSKAPAAGLPRKFRAEPIKSLLPVLPQPPLPALEIPVDPTVPEGEPWQAVLPGSLRYLTVGDRPGVMMVLRHQLFRQSALNGNSDAAQVLVSGSVPVQHRYPRPVPLPTNTSAQLNTALQTWASYFEPERTLLATAGPADEAFFAASGAELAQRVQLVLQEPLHGAITARWKGDLQFAIATASTDIEAEWQIQIQIVQSGQRFDFSTADFSTAGIARFSLDAARQPALQTLIGSLAAGDILTAQATVTPANGSDRFSQTLSFPLRLIDDTALPLPLRPTFIHFEDPEYNRQLVSTAAHATGTVPVQDGDDQVLHAVTLATDRQEYNPSSTLALRYDWDDDRSVNANLALARVSATGAITSLNWPSGSALPSLQAGRLEQISLDNVQLTNDVQFEQGDVLQLTLTVLQVEIVLRLAIVATPVIPATQSAYALLRQLVPTAAHVTGTVSVQDGSDQVSHAVTLAADWQEYNPSSTLALRYDWDDDRSDNANLALARVSATGAITSLNWPSGSALPTLQAGRLEQISLDNVQLTNDVQFEQGDVLQLTLTVLQVEIVLRLAIVTILVNHATQSTYVLLRQEGEIQQVECVRFAWSPQASRVDLVNAADLRTEIVRRRAVFSWSDSVRPENLKHYAIQKITQTGATHFPSFAQNGENNGST